MENLLQVSNSTLYDRYPDVFSGISEIISHDGKNDNNLSILSYGCSTGEEVRTLHEKYFPSARITGTDIDSVSLEIAKRLAINNVSFKELNLVKQEGTKYDVIFCMSVLCRIFQSNMKEHPIAFSDFNNTLIELDSKLNVGGYFVIYNSNYSFFDSDIFDKFIGIRHHKIKKSFSEALMFTKELSLMFDDKVCIYKKIK